MSVRIDKGRLGTGLELTPMIDVVFLLMIFFLVASKLEEADRSIDVVLPKASAARPLGLQHRVGRPGVLHRRHAPAPLWRVISHSSVAD